MEEFDEYECAYIAALVAVANAARLAVNISKLPDMSSNSIESIIEWSKQLGAAVGLLSLRLEELDADYASSE